jgi:hypothetical protein
MSDADVTPEDALQVAQNALGRVSDLEDDVEELQVDRDDAVERLVALELRLSEFEEDRPYQDYSADEKIGMVREHAFDRAADAGGRAALDYQDIKWGVFDGGPSPSHCYDLMRQAAAADGFDVRDPEAGNRQLTVDAETAKASREFLAAKNRSGGEGVS